MVIVQSWARGRMTRFTDSFRAFWLPALNGPGMLRLLLALLVWVSHASRLEVGGPAVMVFFMLSGYWVTGLYLRHNGSIASFMLDRFLRVWPLLAIVAILTVAARLWLDVPAAGHLASTLMLLGLATRNQDVLGVAWSLDFELQFYFALPFLMMLVAPTGVLVKWRALIVLTLTVFIALYQFFDALQTVASHVLRAYRITFVPMLVQIFCFWGIGLYGGWWFCYRASPPLGVEGFWIASVISLVFSAAMLGPLLWKAVRATELPP